MTPEPTEADGVGASQETAIEAREALPRGASIRYFGDYEILGELGVLESLFRAGTWGAINVSD